MNVDFNLRWLSIIIFLGFVLVACATPVATPAPEQTIESSAIEEVIVEEDLPTLTPPQCTTEIAPPSGTEPEELVRLVADPTGDFVLDHPLFTEVYDVVFQDNDSIPPVLDIVQVEVLSEDGSHAIHILTQENGVIEEMSREDQLVSFGVYIDSDGNGVSDYLLTTTDSPERGVIVTPEFEFVAEMPRLVFEDNGVIMTIPEEIVGARFDWLVFSGYSPRADAFHTTALHNVFFVPQVDVVPSVAGMTGIISFYAGPGSCQVIDSRSGMRCPIEVGTSTTTIPGTSIQGKLWYRKRCGTTITEFWCVGGAFGARVSGGVTTGWVGKCPYPCGANRIDAWDSNNDGSLDKVFHSVVDDYCRLLFNLELKFANELDSQTISNALKDQFKDKGYTLGVNPQLVVMDQGMEWKIMDDNKQYRIRTKFSLDGSPLELWVYDAVPLKHYDFDGDDKIDRMEHIYVYATDKVKSCNKERNETTGSEIAARCCPKRQPYANQSDVPGAGIVGSPPSFNCPISAP